MSSTYYRRPTRATIPDQRDNHVATAFGIAGIGLAAFTLAALALMAVGPKPNSYTLYYGDKAPLTITAELPTDLPPCLSDETVGPACVWDASANGNGEGTDFVWVP